MSKPSPSPSTSTGRMIDDLILAARRNPSRFIPFALFDPRGREIRMAKVHVELQQFLTTHPKALIELPRDHGKTVQVCGRIIWELGNNPGLRVKLVCATEAVAQERGRFLRELLAHTAAGLVIVEGEREAGEAVYRFADAVVARGRGQRRRGA